MVNVLNILFFSKFPEKVESLLKNGEHSWFLAPRILAHGNILETGQQQLIISFSFCMSLTGFQIGMFFYKLVTFFRWSFDRSVVWNQVRGFSPRALFILEQTMGKSAAIPQCATIITP
jgi:hypothetical protein